MGFMPETLALQGLHTARSVDEFYGCIGSPARSGLSVRFDFVPD